MASIKKFHLPSCGGSDCECLWVLDYRPLGLFGPRRRMRFKTRKQAERFRTETEHKAARREYVEPAKVPTFRDAAERWFTSKSDRRPSHVADLRTRLDKHILPRIGAERLDRINVAAVEKLRADLRTDKYASRTVNTIIRIIGAVFKSSIRRGECALNPVERIERNFTAARELTADDRRGSSDEAENPGSILNPEEVGMMLGATSAGLYRALFTTAALTGMRSGELFGLTWGNIELPKNGTAYIYVRQTVSWARVSGEEIRPRFYPPKTRAGTRRIPIAYELAITLKAWKLQCPVTADDLVFPAADGRPIRRSNALRYGLWGGAQARGTATREYAQLAAQLRECVDCARRGRY